MQHKQNSNFMLIIFNLKFYLWQIIRNKSLFIGHSIVTQLFLNKKIGSIEKSILPQLYLMKHRGFEPDTHFETLIERSFADPLSKKYAKKYASHFSISKALKILISIIFTQL